MDETIEILSSNLLRLQKDTTQNLLQYAKTFPLNMGIGWHYPLDWTWIISQIQFPQGKTILDAGAGLGLLQWYLADQGATVISVDRSSRACLPLHLRKRYRVRGLRPHDLLSPGQIINPLDRSATWNEKGKSLLHTLTALPRRRLKGFSPGEIVIYNQDLGNLVDIAEQSVDLVISVSALEHNAPEQLPVVVDELKRVLKPGGAIIATLGAAKKQDWFHNPSKGWCYTDESLRKAFKFSSDISSNYHLFDKLLEDLRNCHELYDHLDPVYFRSGDNGMPWGKWDPQYQPVGVIKLKG